MVRENTEGEPAALVAGIAARGPGKQVALQMGLFTEEAIWAVPSLAASALPARLGPRISRAGKGIANPIGQLWSAVLMLKHLRVSDAGVIITVIREVAIELD
ncbi:MAG: hypothetical protein JOY61_06970 [Chloroflexi bacterium]|nr:hypothetical protein [Chloroflexota bacterium]